MKVPLKAPEYEPLLLEEIINIIVQYGALKETTNLYNESSLVEKATIEKTIVMYMTSFNVHLNGIIDQLLASLANVLNDKRNVIVVEEDKMRQALDKAKSSISIDYQKDTQKSSRLNKE